MMVWNLTGLHQNYFSNMLITIFQFHDSPRYIPLKYKNVQLEIYITKLYKDIVKNYNKSKRYKFFFFNNYIF